MFANVAEFLNDYTYAAFFGLVAAIIYYIPYARRTDFPIRQAIHTLMIGDAAVACSVAIPKIIGLWSSAPIDTGFSSKMPLLTGLGYFLPAFTIFLAVLLVIVRLVTNALRPEVTKV